MAAASNFYQHLEPKPHELALIDMSCKEVASRKCSLSFLLLVVESVLANTFVTGSRKVVISVTCSRKVLFVISVTSSRKCRSNTFITGSRNVVISVTCSRKVLLVIFVTSSKKCSL